MKGLLGVRNLYDFTNLKDYNFKWELLRNGEAVDSAYFSVTLDPHSTRDVKLDLPNVYQDGNEYFLNVYAYTRKATTMLPEHYEVAREQFKLGDGNFFLTKEKVVGELSVERNGNILSFKSGSISGRFDLKKGVFYDYTLDGQSPIVQYPEPAFWRAPVDNDFGNKMPLQCGVWRTAHVNRSLLNVVVGEKDDNGILVRMEWMLNDIQVPYTVEYQICNDGSVVVTGSMDMTGRKLPELPRFGMCMELKNGYENLVYYGRGPQENYIDRCSSTFVGRYEDKVRNQYYEYIRPQETGNKTDVRWLTLCNDNGVGIQITGLQPIAFSALHFAPEDLDPGLTRKMQHSIDVIPRKNIFLHVDLKQRGLGGDNSWGMYPHSEYRLLDKKYSYSYRMKLVELKKAD